MGRLIAVAVVVAILGGCVLGGTTPRQPSTCALRYRAEAVIAAPADRVWQVLADLPGYPAWNPWLRFAAGDLTPGHHVRAKVVMGAKLMDADHVVLAVDPGARLCWRDAGWTTLFVFGQRCRWIEPLGDGRVRFHQELILEGMFSPMAEVMYGDALRAGMAAETRALKARVESR